MSAPVGLRSSGLRAAVFILLFLGWSTVIWSRSVSAARPLPNESQRFGERLTIAAKFCDPLPIPVKALFLQMARWVERDPGRRALIEGRNPHKNSVENLSPGYRLYETFLQDPQPDGPLAQELRVLASHALLRLNACLVAFSLILLAATVSLLMGPRPRDVENVSAPQSWSPTQVLSLYFAWEIFSHFGIGRVLAAGGGSLSSFGRIGLSTILTAIFPALLVGYGAWKKSWRPLQGGLLKTSWGWIGPAYVATLVGIPAINTLVETVLGYPLPDSGFVHFLAAQTEPAKIFGLMVVAVVLAPFYEEVMFRGLLLGGLVPALGKPRSLLLGGAVFATAHGDIGHFPALFFLGWLLGWLYLKTGSLWVTVAVHMMWNAGVLCLLFATIP